MIRLEILTEGFRSPNGCAFLYPFIAHRRALAAAGIVFAIRRKAAEVHDADIIVVDSKFHRDRWSAGADGILAEFASLRRRADALVYADTVDSSSWLQSAVLPAVDLYWKGALLRDRTRYLRPIYGHRIYAEHYHDRYGVDDSRPEWSTAVADAALLGKLRMSWNSALANYSWLGPYRMSLGEYLPATVVLGQPNYFTPPSAARTIDVHCRMGTTYPRASVAHQRKMIANKLASRRPTDKISRRRYIRELEQSRTVVSPFGFGEITLKDFEAFLAGALLLKPDMSHLETWPDLFRADETMIVHDWDLENFDAVLERALSEREKHLAIAAEGQRRYRDHLTRAEPFVEHLSALIGQGRATPKMGKSN